MFCIAICDDEKIFREQMKEILLNYMEDRGVLYEVLLGGLISADLSVVDPAANVQPLL